MHVHGLIRRSRLECSGWTNRCQSARSVALSPFGHRAWVDQPLFCTAIVCIIRACVCVVRATRADSWEHREGDKNGQTQYGAVTVMANASLSCRAWCTHPWLLLSHANLACVQRTRARETSPWCGVTPSTFTTPHYQSRCCQLQYCVPPVTRQTHVWCIAFADCVPVGSIVVDDDPTVTKVVPSIASPPPPPRRTGRSWSWRYGNWIRIIGPASSPTASSGRLGTGVVGTGGCSCSCPLISVQII